MEFDAVFAQYVSKRAGTDQRPIIAQLMESARSGHLCLESAEELPSELCQHLSAIDQICKKPIGRFENRLYFAKNWHSETQVIAQLKRLVERKIPALQPVAIDGLTDEQKNAVALALQSPLMILSGGPGRGKTYTATKIMRSLPKEATIVAAAPTGKAARHLGSSVKREIVCGTLHAIFELYRKEPKKIEPDLLIIDECSMIDARAWAKILGAVGPKTRVVLMGDPDQLPPVDAGTLFAQMCQLNLIPHAKLTACLRSDRKDLLDFAESIRIGCPELDIESSYVTITPPTKFPNLHPERFLKEEYRILCALKKGPQGADAINKKIYFTLQDEVGPIPIVITKSDRDLELFNGETGVISEGMGHFSGREPLPVGVLPPYEYAYATTVHKSQGGEFDHVLLILSEGSHQFGRELLYTAVTRTRKTIEIIATREAIIAASSTSSQRESGLLDRYPVL